MHQGDEDLGNQYLAGNGVQARANVASTISPGGYIAGQHFGQGRKVARCAGRDKGRGQLALIGGLESDTVPFLGNMAFRAMKELAAMLRGFLNDLGNLRERVVKRLMQEENRSFQWVQGPQ